MVFDIGADIPQGKSALFGFRWEMEMDPVAP